MTSSALTTYNNAELVAASNGQNYSNSLSVNSVATEARYAARAYIAKNPYLDKLDPEVIELDMLEQVAEILRIRTDKQFQLAKDNPTLRKDSKEWRNFQSEYNEKRKYTNSDAFLDMLRAVISEELHFFFMSNSNTSDGQKIPNEPNPYARGGNGPNVMPEPVHMQPPPPPPYANVPPGPYPPGAYPPQPPYAYSNQPFPFNQGIVGKDFFPSYAQHLANRNAGIYIANFSPKLQKEFQRQIICLLRNASDSSIRSHARMFHPVHNFVITPVVALYGLLAGLLINKKAQFDKGFAHGANTCARLAPGPVAKWALQSIPQKAGRGCPLFSRFPIIAGIAMIAATIVSPVWHSIRSGRSDPGGKMSPKKRIRHIVHEFSEAVDGGALMRGISIPSENKANEPKFSDQDYEPYLMFLLDDLSTNVGFTLIFGRPPKSAVEQQSVIELIKQTWTSKALIDADQQSVKIVRNLVRDVTA